MPGLKPEVFAEVYERAQILLEAIPPSRSDFNSAKAAVMANTHD